MIRCHYIGTPLGAMTLPRPIRSLLVFAFAAWMSLCCCEKRILAHAFDSAPQSSVPSCCAEHCCADDASERDGDSNRDNRESHDSSQPRNCADGCCVKGATAAPVFVLDLDLVGCPLPPSIARDLVPANLAGRALAHDDRAVGEPPPRLALVISRRLRI